MAVKGKEVAGNSAKGKNVAGESASGKRKAVTVASIPGGSGSGKRARPGPLRFLDDEAADAGSEEGDASGSEESDFIDDDGVGDELAVSKQCSKTGRVFALPLDVKEEAEYDAELEKYIRERFASGSKCVAHADEWEDAKDLDGREELGPTKADPNIWKVKCMVNKERHLAFCLIQKYRAMETVINELKDMATIKDGLKIISAFALDHVKGYIFVEAERQCDVVEACKGFCNVYLSRITLVPKNEAPHLLSVQNKTFKVSVGTWVRMKAGIYKGDLAKVVDFDTERERVMIKLIPRIDLQAIAQKFGGGVTYKPATVPAAQLIRPFQLKDFQTHIESRRDQQTGEIFEILDGMMLKNGFLYKKVSLGSLSYWEIQPSASEIQKFEMAGGGVDNGVFFSSVRDGGKQRFCVKDEKMNGTCETSSGSKVADRFKELDFVLINQKDFGVIIALEEDSLKILKGKSEMEEEIISIQLQEIKSQINDRMFTALDKEKTRISIGDGVRVSLGRHEGKEGFVKHMYRGALFIHDASQSENLGLFVTRADLVVKTSSKATCHKGTDLASHLPDSEDLACPNRESPKRAIGRDSFRSFASTSQVNDLPFSMGQTLRIRVGTLKGHLCKVIALFRSDVAVKLQSNSKIIKVSCDHLSELKNRGSSFSGNFPASEFEKPFGEDILGGSTTGGDQENDPWGNNIDKSSKQMDGWNSQPASGGNQENDPWGDNTDKSSKQMDGWNSQPASEKDQENDPWGCKTEQSSHSMNEWNAQPKSEKDQENDPWGSKTDLSNQPMDEWSTQLRSEKDQENDPWGSKTAQSSEAMDNWNTKPKSEKEKENDPWGSRTNQPSLSLDEWSTQTRAGKEQENDPWRSKTDQSSRPKDDWNAQPRSGKEIENDPWGSKKDQSSQPMNEWNAHPASRKDKENGPWDSKTDPFSQPVGGWSTQTRSGKDQANDPWGSKQDQPSLPMDGWGTQRRSGNDQENDPWGSKTQSSEPVDGWNSHVSSWSNAAAGGSQVVEAHDGWSKDKPWGDAKGSSWGQERSFFGAQRRSENDQENDPWGSKTQSSEPVDGWNSHVSSWSNAAAGGSQVVEAHDGWSKDKPWGDTKGSSWGQERSFSGEGRGYGDKGDEWSKSRTDDTLWGKQSGGGGDESRDQHESWNTSNRSFTGGRGSGGRREGDFTGGRRGRGDFSGGRRGGDFSGGRRGGGDFSGGRRGGDFSGGRRGRDFSGGRGRGEFSGRGRFSARGRSGGWSEDRDSEWSKRGGNSENQNSWNDGEQLGGWKNKNSFGEGSLSSGWNKGTYESGEQLGGWNDKNAFGGESAGWNKGTDEGKEQSGGWNSKGGWNDKNAFGGESTGWNKGTDEGKEQSGGWNNKGGWNDKNAFGGESTGWNKGTDEGKEQSGGWNSKKAFGGDKLSTGWHKDTDESKQSDGWNSNSASGENRRTGWNDGTLEAKDKSAGWNSKNAFGENKPSWNSDSSSAGWNTKLESGATQTAGWAGSNQSGGWTEGSDFDKPGPRSWDKTKSYDHEQSSGWMRGGDNGGRGGRRGGRRGGSGCGRNNGRGRGDSGFTGWNNEKGEGGNVRWSSDGNRGGRGFGDQSHGWSSDKDSGRECSSSGWSNGGQGGGAVGGGGSSADCSNHGGWNTNSDKGILGSHPSFGWNAGDEAVKDGARPKWDSWSGSKKETGGGQAEVWKKGDAPESSGNGGSGWD